MAKYRVAITRYRNKVKSVKKVIELSNAFGNLSGDENVFLKPNIVFWIPDPNYPKYGVVTTSRVVEDTIIALKEHGISDITIGEGIVTADPKDFETARHAFEYLGYNKFKKKYGIDVINVSERPFEKVDIGQGLTLNFSSDFLHSDFIVSLPVLKTHSQARISLGMKNLKGLIDVSSRKKCHSADIDKDLDFYLSRLSKNLPPSCAIIDGIYTNERGPGYDGRMRRKNVLIASSDLFSADKVGAKVLGYDASDVPYLVHYAKNNNRPIDLSDVEVLGRTIESVQEYHEYKFPYNEQGSNPIAFEKQGIKGISYRQYDNTTCTYCSAITSVIPLAITYAWNGDPWDDVEIILGKRMNPTPGKKKTILLGQCMFNKHRNSPEISEMIPIKGCPAKMENIVKALHQAGINVNHEIFENLEKIPIFYGLAYKHRFNEFQESFFNLDAKDETIPPIDDIAVSQFYLDDDTNLNNIPRKQSKFEVRFFGLFGEKSTNAIKRIVVSGPKNYEFQFKSQPFNFKDGNGYIVDNFSRGMIKYIAFDRNGFLEDGEYQIKVEYGNGEQHSKSRHLSTNGSLLENYIAAKDKIKYSYEELPKYMGDPKIYVRTKWLTLKKLGSVDGYYSNYVSEGKTHFINLHDLTHDDKMFLNSILMPSYGLNKEFSLINTRWKPLKSNTEYTWLTEIYDSNKLSSINLSIYQPHQWFKTA